MVLLTQERSDVVAPLVQLREVLTHAKAAPSACQNDCADVALASPSESIREPFAHPIIERVQRIRSIQGDRHDTLFEVSFSVHASS